MTARVLAILLAILALATVLHLLRHRRIREKYAVIWLFLSIGIVILTAFEEIPNWLASHLGIVTPSNLLFLIAVAVLFVISVQLSIEVGELEGESRALAEEVAILRLRVDELTGAAPRQAIATHADNPATPPRADDTPAGTAY